MALVKTEGSSKKKTKTKPKEDEVELVLDEAVLLPTEFNEPPGNLLDYILMIHGLKGIGKTSVIAALNAFILMFEPLRKNVKFRGHYKSLVTPGDPFDWESGQMVMKGMIDKGPENMGCQVVGLDSLDRSYQKCMDFVCARKGITHPHEANDYGKTWNEVQAEYETSITKLCYAGFTPIFTSHTKTRDEDSPEPYDMLPTATGRAFLVSKALCDIVLYYGMIDGVRAFTIRGGTGVYTACGIEDRFLDAKTGVPLAAFEAGDTPAKSAANLIAAFNNEMEGIPYIPGQKLSETDYFRAKQDEAKEAGIIPGESSAQRGSKLRKK